MANRTAEDDLWEAQRDTLHRLYIQEDKTLKDLMSIMTANHGFKKTKAQYERMLKKKWKWRKNLNSEEWRHVTHRVGRRSAEGKQSKVCAFGIELPQAKLNKEMARYGYQSILTQFAVSPPREAPTPPEITISTPPFLMMMPSRAASPILTTSPNLAISPILAPSSTFTVDSMQWFDRCYDATPWSRFAKWTEYMEDGYPQPLLTLPADWRPAEGDQTTWSRLYRPDEADSGVELAVRVETSQLKQWIDRLTFSSYFNFDGADYANSSCTTFDFQKSAFGRFTALLPSRTRSSIGVDLMSMTNITQQKSQLDFLKLAVLSLSNNADMLNMSSVVIELLSIRENRDLLKTLLRVDLYAVKSFAEKLLVPAVHSGNRELVELLLDNDIDIDARAFISMPSFQDEFTALECSIAAGNRELFRMLFSRGAGGSNDSSLLDVALKSGNADIVNELLDPRIRSDPRIKHPTLETAELACKHQDATILRALFQSYPTLPESLKGNTVGLLESAAYNGNQKVIQLLVSYGFDLNSTDGEGLGSAVAAAALGGHNDMVILLLNLGAAIDGFGQLRQFSAYYQTMTGLQIALQRCDFRMSHTLIERKADPNHYLQTWSGWQGRKPAPIHIACRFCDAATVELLLEAGADPNAPNQARGSWFRTFSGFYRHNKPITLSPIDSLDGQTDLQLAMARGDHLMCDLLIKHGASLEDQIMDGRDLLTAALVGGNTQLIDMVLNATMFELHSGEALQACIEFDRRDLAMHLIGKASPNACSKAIVAAIYREDQNLVQQLLSLVLIQFGTFPIEVLSAGIARAAKQCNIALLSLFLSHGAKPYALTASRTVSLRIVDQNHVRLKKGTNAIVELLSERLTPTRFQALDILLVACSTLSSDLSDWKEYRSALLAALERSLGQPEWKLMLKKLVDAGADINSYTTTRGKTLLVLAAEIAQLDAVKHLLSHGANPNVRVDGRFDVTALQVAALGHEISIVQLLLEHGADANAGPAYSTGATALQYAAMHGNIDIVRLLIEADADVNAHRSREYGRTALEGAAEQGRLDMVRFLLECGADISNSENKQYERAVYRAWMEGYRVLARMLHDFRARKFGFDQRRSIEEICRSVTKGDLNWQTFCKYGTCGLCEEWREREREREEEERERDRLRGKYKESMVGLEGY